eukprot:Pgem_evm1s7164
MIADFEIDKKKWIACIETGISNPDHLMLESDIHDDFGFSVRQKSMGGMSALFMKKQCNLAPERSNYGLIKKMGGKNNQKPLKTRFLVCYNHILLYYESEECKKPKGVVSLYEYSSVKRRTHEQIVLSGGPGQSKLRTFIFQIEDPIELTKWIR